MRAKRRCVAGPVPDGRVVCSRSESCSPLGGGDAAGTYEGGFHLEGEGTEPCLARLYPDYETLTGLEMTQTILFPSFKNRVTRLTGLKLGVSGSGERMPCCARVVYEYLGHTIEVRRALRLCGLYELDDERVDEATRRAVTNDIAPGEWHFRARY